MTSTEIRNMWYDYFTSHGHKKVESAPLIPINDDSLLWINAGVTPLKKYFDGREIPDSRRLCNIQKCIRTNDIDNVGRTSRHCTFFEMMGNFSIGDYFREEAISMSYELLTSESYFGIPKEKLYVTIYTDDLDSRDCWIKAGLDEDHIVPLKENFWEIGEGPCGPDSEIFYDRGEKYDVDGHALDHFKNDEDQDRYVEIWNNVFSQFNAKSGKKREEYEELPHKNIDTGAGLERWACVFQEVDSNFETDLFKPIIDKISEISGKEYDDSMPFKVVADHIRALTMALSDGAIFENNGRGYVLRRLLRRAVRYGKKLGINEPFMYKLVETVVSIMKDSYPDLVNNQGEVKVKILDEENLFFNTLSSGEKRLEELISNNNATKVISGRDVFKLQDTYGFPYELTLEYLEEVGFTTDKEEYDRCMNEQKESSKSSRKQDSKMNLQNAELLSFTKESEFEYYKYKTKGTIIGIFNGESFVDSIKKDGYVVFDKTCFYATQGGQVADTGMITSKEFKARVLDVMKAPNGQHMLKVKLLTGTIKVGDEASQILDEDRRKRIECNHSSVHILQNALQNVLGDQVKQAGSFLNEDYLRFDFTYTNRISDQEIVDVEDYVNDVIRQQIETETKVMSIEDAKKTNAMQLFGEKYGDKVRVVTIGDSREFCGGTHTGNTRNIGKFAITNIESKGSNVYRIEGVTGDAIEDALTIIVQPITDKKVKEILKAKDILSLAKKEGFNLSFEYFDDDISLNSYRAIIKEKNNYEYIREEVKNLDKEYHSLKNKKDLSDVSKYMDDKFDISDGNGLIIKLSGVETDTAKSLADELLNRLVHGFVVVIKTELDKATIIVRSNSEIKANALLKMFTDRLNGNGGGKEEFATGGTRDIDNIDKVIEEIKKEVSI